MSQIVVDRERCRKDGVCVAVCPSRTLGVDEQGFPVEGPNLHCILCGQCVAVCSFDALTHTGLPDEPFLPMPEKLPAAEMLDGLLKSRRSVRVFKDKPVPRQTLAELLDIARRAPTATNSQTLHWIVLDSPEKVHTLSEKLLEYLRVSRDRPVYSGLPVYLAAWEKGYDWFLRGAPTVVVACAPANYQWGRTDAAIALTFMELAAEARSLGACWTGYLTRIAAVYPPISAMLQVPEEYAVCGGLMLGEPRYKYRKIPPRKPLSVQWI